MYVDVEKSTKGSDVSTNLVMFKILIMCFLLSFADVWLVSEMF